MRALIALAAFAMAFTSIPAVQAQSLEQLTQRLQETPDDNTLREQIIKQAQKEKPAIPEEARRAFVQGSTLARESKDTNGQKLAIESFENAVRIAPWWGDAYYNLAIAQELAGEYDSARSSFDFYILTNPGEKESRAAQDRIYVLEAKEKLNRAEKAAVATKAPQTQLPDPQKRNFDGLRCVAPVNYPAGVFEKGYEVRGQEVVAITILVQIFRPEELGALTQIGQLSTGDRYILRDDTFETDYGSVGIFSSDGSHLTISGSESSTYPCK